MLTKNTGAQVNNLRSRAPLAIIIINIIIYYYCKKQRINTGSDLLDEVRECFAFVHGADMFSVPNQHSGFGDPMFPSSNMSSSMPNVYNSSDSCYYYGNGYC